MENFIRINVLLALKSGKSTKESFRVVFDMMAPHFDNDVLESEMRKVMCSVGLNA